jgi:hypothetical protein
VAALGATLHHHLSLIWRKSWDWWWSHSSWVTIHPSRPVVTCYRQQQQQWREWRGGAKVPTQGLPKHQPSCVLQMHWATWCGWLDQHHWKYLGSCHCRRQGESPACHRLSHRCHEIVGTPVYHSGIPVMHTTHDPMISMSWVHITELI